MNDLPDDLAKALAALDARAAKAAASVDAERVADGVLRRLRAEPAAVAPRWIRVALRIAAAVAVLATGAVVTKLALDGRRSDAVATLPVEVPDSLNTQQAAAVLEALAAIADSTAATAAITVDDLNETELRTLLQTMQSDLEGAL